MPSWTHLHLKFNNIQIRKTKYPTIWKLNMYFVNVWLSAQYLHQLLPICRWSSMKIISDCVCLGAHLDKKKCSFLTFVNGIFSWYTVLCWICRLGEEHFQTAHWPAPQFLHRLQFHSYSPQQLNTTAPLDTETINNNKL